MTLLAVHCLAANHLTLLCMYPDLPSLSSSIVGIYPAIADDSHSFSLTAFRATWLLLPLVLVTKRLHEAT